MSMRKPLAFLAFVALLAASCSSPSSPEVQPGPDGSIDSVLVEGRDIFGSNCTRCHGASGNGTRRAPKLNDGRVIQQYPEISDQIKLVTDGRSGMPSFGSKLDADEIEAVVRYSREVLSGVSS